MGPIEKRGVPKGPVKSQVSVCLGTSSLRPFPYQGNTPPLSVWHVAWYVCGANRGVKYA